MAEKQTEGRVEDDLLYSARHGDAEAVKNVLVNAPDQFNINYKGKNKANFGWSALHLASYFGHTDVVNLLLKNEADVNIINNVGDTPLHRAAYTGRLDVVISLLKHNADVSLINSEGHTPKQVSKTAEIRNMMKAAENVELRKCEEEFLQTARDGCLDNLAIILRSGSLSSINCVDNFGNTALHQAAYRGQKESAILLLQNGIDPAIKNARGQTALNLARNEQMKQLLDVRPITQLQRDVQRFEGQLFKRSRILGWKPYWVVLGKGVLSLFRNRADASTGSKRKGFKYLDDAQVQVRTESPLMFGVRFSDNTSMTFCVDARSSTSLDRQKWENALAEHISYSNHYTHQGQKNISDDEMEDILPLGSMQDALQTAQAHEHVLEREVSQVTQTIESILSLRTASPVMLAQVRQQLSQIMESSREMVGSLSHSLAIFTQQDELRKIQVQQATEKSRVLQDALHILAEEHLDLERSLGAHRSSVMYDSDQEEFFDCPEVLSQGSYSSSVSTDASALNHNNCDLTSEGKGSLEGTDVHSQGDSRLANETSKWGGRRRLPVPMFSRNDFSVWSILKQCIGKELSKITMPVIFNEPISFLQRIVEYMEYAALLRKASESPDPVERMEYVTAFAISATASNWDRLGKPFNPLLGETYELERDDLGFRICCEQVSHHPPVSAFHAESPLYTLHGTVYPKLKFWGKSVEVTPKGTVTLTLLKHNEVYSWQNVNCCVHNIIVGKLWIEHYGAMEVTNHTTGYKSVLNFKPSGWFDKDLHKVEGCVLNANKKKVRYFYGKWIEGVFSHDVEVYENYIKNSAKQQESSWLSPLPNNSTPEANGAASNTGSEAVVTQLETPENVPMRGSTCNLALPGQTLLWHADHRPRDANQYYSFTLFAMMLNEMEEGMQTRLPPTDCRLRPDIHKLELGHIDAAAEEKNRLEEKQRAARKERRKRKEEWQTRWFSLDTNPHTGKEDWLFNETYWSRDWSNCPEIF